MGNDTPRFGLGTFEQGDEWDHTDTVEAVDKRAIERGPIADRPASGEYDDELYLAVDQRILWKWDADTSDWTAISGVGSGDNPIPGTSHYEDINAEAVTAETVASHRPTLQADSRSGFVEPRQAQRPNQQQFYSRPSEKPLFTWFFDDNRLSIYENRAVFANKDVIPGVAACPGLFGTGETWSKSGTDDESFTWEQLLELYEEYDWEVLNHSDTHRGFTNQATSQSQHERQVYDSTAAFLDRGIAPTYFVYPYNETGGDSGMGIVSELYQFAFGSGLGNQLYESMSPFDMNRVPTDGNSNSLDEIKSIIDDALAANTGLILYGHSIIEGPADDDGRWITTTGRIEEIIDYVRDNGGEWADGGTEEVIRKSSRNPWQIGSANSYINYRGDHTKQYINSDEEYRFVIGEDITHRISDDDWEVSVPITFQTDGEGPVVTSPDGSETKVIGIDNNGNLEARDP